VANVEIMMLLCFVLWISCGIKEPMDHTLLAWNNVIWRDAVHSFWIFTMGV